MRNFLQNLKNMVMGRRIALGLTSVRIGNNPVSILSRFSLVSLILMTVGVGPAWGVDRSWRGGVAVGQGKGEVKVEVFWKVVVEGTDDDATSSGTTVEYASASQSAILSSSIVKRGCKYSVVSTSTGYTFKGWYSSSACSGTAASTSSSWTAKSATTDSWDITYWAKFTPNSYDVTLKANGGTGSDQVVSATYDADMPTTKKAGGSITAPTKTGYTFAGYYDAASGGTKYYNANLTSAKKWDKASATTLYAQWTANTYEVVFNGNGSTSGSMDNQEFTYDAAAKALSAFTSFKREYTVTYAPNGGTTATTTDANTKASYSFANWNTKESGNGTSYADKASVSNLATSGTFDLYAQWNSASVTLPEATLANHVIEGWYKGSVDVPANKVGVPGDSYTPTENTTLTAKWIERYPFTMSGSDRTMNVDDEISDAFTFTYAENPTAHIEITSISSVKKGDAVIEYDAANNKLIARNAGVATIYFTQANTETILAGTSDTWTITVNKIANTLSVASETYTGKYVDDVIADIISNKNSDATVTTTSAVTGMTGAEAAKVAYYNVSDNKIYMPNTDAVSFTSKTITINIAQAETYKYEQVSKNITLTVNKYQTSFTGSAYNLMVDGTQTANYTYTNTSAAKPTANSSDDFYYTVDITAYSNVNLNQEGGFVIFNPDNKLITAKNAGSGKITLRQKQTYKYTGDTVSYNVAVYKYNSVFSGQASLNTTVEASVASAYVLTYAKPNDAYIGADNHAAGAPALNSGNWYYTLGHNITTANQVGCPNDYQDVVISYNAENKQATGRNQGAATVSLYQVETYKYNSASTSFNVNVAKNANALSCSWGSWSKDMNVDSETGVTISANNAQTPIVVEQTSGDDEGNVIATYSSTNNKITSIYNIGTATWSVSQAENYKYVAAESKTLTVNVKKASQPTCYVVDHPDEQSVYSMWGQGDEYCDAIALDGIGESLVSFEAKKDGGTGDVSVVQYSKDNGQNWTTLRSAFGISSGFQEFGPFAFPALANGERITHIRFGVSATTSMISYRYKNIKVSRKKWFKLEDKDGNEISSLEMPTNTLGGNHTTAKFTVDYSTCADQIKVVSNHPHITVSPASFASEGNGTKEITVTYACDDPESIDGVITVYTPYENKTINVHAATEKKSQEIKWSDLFVGETVSLPQTFTSNDAASATSKLPVTYTSGNSEIIEVAEDGLSFTVVGTGPTTLTAIQAGDDIWKYTSDTKTINASNKKIQRIKWNQQFTRSLSVGNKLPLTATVTVLNIATGVETESVERSAEIVYTCPADNGVIEIFNETNIRVLGYGNTTITASVAGNEDYEAATPVTLPVRVREMQTGDCDMPLVLEQNDEIEFFQGNLDAIYGSAIAINHANGIPDKLSFDVRGAAWKLAIEYYKGGIIAQQSIDNQMNWSDLTASAISPAKGGTESSGEIQLNPNATHIRFVRPSGGQGYHYVGNIHITRLPYLRTENTTIDLGNISVGEKRDFTIPVSYCSVRGNMSVSKQYTDNSLTIEETIEADCGDMSSHDLQASILPTVVGPWTNTVTVRDPLSNMTLDVTINASIQKGDQVITWNPTLEILTTEAPVLNAVASSGLAVSYAVTSGNNTIARIDNGQVVILQPGTFAITASQSGNSNYNAAPSVVKEFTVTAETLTLIEAPTASDLTYGQTLSASTLTGGSVEDSKHNLVAGTFSWQAGNTTPNAGNAQKFTVVFTPSSNAVWYNTLQTTAEVNVAKATPTLSWQNAPEDLAYDATNVLYTATSTSNEGAITYSIINGGDYASIHSESGELTINVPGHEITIQASQEETLNYNAPDVITVTVTIEAAPITEPNVFTNNAGDNDWDNPNNWTSVPTGETPDIIVSGELVIDEEVTVGSITIQSTGGVTVVTDGILTVTGVSEDIASYGDLHVKNDGEVILANTADLKVNNFILDAKLGDADKQAASGQIFGIDHMTIDNKVYFDITFDPRGYITFGWYDFAVPFEVNINGGISRINSTSDKVMVSGKDFILKEADEAARANGGYIWRKVTSSVLTPGKLYTITLDDEVNQNTLRFTWNGHNGLSNGTSFDPQFTASGSDTEMRGWNGVGNGMLSHGYPAVSYKRQAYNHDDNKYELVTGDKTFAVGSAFVIQVPDENSFDWTPAQSSLTRPLFAPQYETYEVDEFLLNLRQTETNKVADKLYFSASDDATDAYVIGRDLLKMGNPLEAKSAQMWATKGGRVLCDVEATLYNDNASTPITFFAPQAGTYTLSVDEMPENASLYLTYEGKAIWLLSAGAYTLDLEKGTTEGFGLRLVTNASQVTTGVDAIESEDGTNRKVIINNTMYIITKDGAIYDVLGKSVKN